MAKKLTMNGQFRKSVAEVFDDFVISKTAQGVSDITIANYHQHLHSIPLAPGHKEAHKLPSFVGVLWAVFFFLLDFVVKPEDMAGIVGNMALSVGVGVSLLFVVADDSGTHFRDGLFHR